ncbi:hypothetical protein B0T14DRAFT_498254 [Immersiella caudata]|uniref:Uncharacterized protein n=1 Tax=Immersiella caudata TaxID=314043 RepID=A0AA39WKP3_9PEZI|nr:hypothetical protein B0T14DRAFT_498254 [Immersiella caudata]
MQPRARKVARHGPALACKARRPYLTETTPDIWKSMSSLPILPWLNPDHLLTPSLSASCCLLARVPLRSATGYHLVSHPRSENRRLGPGSTPVCSPSYHQRYQSAKAYHQAHYPSQATPFRLATMSVTSGSSRSSGSSSSSGSRRSSSSRKSRTYKLPHTFAINTLIYCAGRRPRHVKAIRVYETEWDDSISDTGSSWSDHTWSTWSSWSTFKHGTHREYYFVESPYWEDDEDAWSKPQKPKQSKRGPVKGMPKRRDAHDSEDDSDDDASSEGSMDEYGQEEGPPGGFHPGPQGMPMPMPGMGMGMPMPGGGPPGGFRPPPGFPPGTQFSPRPQGMPFRSPPPMGGMRPSPPPPMGQERGPPPGGGGGGFVPGRRGIQVWEN